jgi:hypothetical protein
MEIEQNNQSSETEEGARSHHVASSMKSGQPRIGRHDTRFHGVCCFVTGLFWSAPQPATTLAIEHRPDLSAGHPRTVVVGGGNLDELSTD